MYIFNTADVNECSSNPCVNGGVCADSLDMYACLCPDCLSPQTPVCYGGINCDRCKIFRIWHQRSKSQPNRRDINQQWHTPHKKVLNFNMIFSNVIQNAYVIFLICSMQRAIWFGSDNGCKWFHYKGTILSVSGFLRQGGRRLANRIRNTDGITNILPGWKCLLWPECNS